MTTNTSIANLALQKIGTRTTIASLSENSNEAIQANLVITQLRDEVIRRAPWNCAKNYANAVLISAAPGTPENTSPPPTTWNKGLPYPPWAYEYQYPVDCLRPLFVIPQFQTGFSGGVPITTAVTGGVPSFWNGPPSRFLVGIDQFFGVTAAIVSAGGSGYMVGDQITLASTPAGTAPIGAPAVLQVATTGGGGSVATVTVVNQVQGEATPIGGSYFAIQTNPVAQGSTTGAGTGATFTLTQATPSGDQRIILTNQENATLCYMRQVTDPNVFDPLFLDAWAAILGARLTMALTGDKSLANLMVSEANEAVMEARKADGNEGLTINDVTPDWIRVRGIQYPVWETSPNVTYDWGPLFTPYG